MRKFVLIILAVVIVLMTACSNSENSIENLTPTISSNIPQGDVSSVSDEKSEMYVEVVTKGGRTISFKLHDSAAAREFYEQLPLSIQIEDYAGSEKIFYPPEKLNTENAPAAKGPAGTLAYYEPWGNIAFFYGECDGASGLYELGKAITGVEYITEMTGEIEIVKSVSEVSNAANANTISESLSEPSEGINSTESRQTSTNGTTVSDNTSSFVVNTQEPEVTASEMIEDQNSTTSQSAVTSTTTVIDITSADTSSTTESNQKNEMPSSNSESESKNPSNTSTKAPEISSTVMVNDQEPEQSTDKEENTLSIKITVNGRTFSATLYDNETSREFKKRLPITLDMSELNGNEKYYYLPDSLPRNSNIPSGINAGDIMLYGSDCLVIFYESFSTSYSYTPIGKIVDPDELAAVLGNGSVQVTFS